MAKLAMGGICGKLSVVVTMKDCLWWGIVKNCTLRKGPAGFAKDNMDCVSLLVFLQAFHGLISDGIIRSPRLANFCKRKIAPIESLSLLPRYDTKKAYALPLKGKIFSVRSFFNISSWNSSFEQIIVLAVWGLFTVVTCLAAGVWIIEQRVSSVDCSCANIDSVHCSCANILVHWSCANTSSVHCSTAAVQIF